MLCYSGNLGGGNSIPMNNYDISKQFKGTIFTLGLIREGCKTKIQKNVSRKNRPVAEDRKLQDNIIIDTIIIIFMIRIIFIIFSLNSIITLS